MKLQQYPFVLLLVGVIGGILLYEWIGNVCYSLLFLVSVLVMTLGYIVLSFRSLTNRWLLNSRMPLLFFVVMGWSYWNCCWQDIRNRGDWYGHYIETTSHYVGIINSPISEKTQTFQFDIKLQLAVVDTQQIPITGQVPVYVFKKGYPKCLKEGDVVLLENTLSPILPTNNPFVFEYSTYLARKGIFHQTFLSVKDIYLVHSSATSNSRFRVLKQKINAILQHNVSDPTTLALMQATMLNERALLNDDIWKTYSKTGIVHIISISGMHVSILLSVFLFLFYSIKNKRHQWIKYLCALPLIWLYILLTDSPASAVRAGLMFTILTFSILFSKRHHPINTWAGAAFLMLVFQPSWFFDIGMQLSFTCILSIILFYQPIYKMWYVRNRVMRYIWQGLAVSLAVQILAAPIVVYYFHQFPIWIFVANIPAALFSTVLMIGTFAILLLSVFGVPMQWLGDWLAVYTDYFNAFIATLSSWTPDFFSRFHVDVLDAVLLMFVLLFSFLCLKYRQRNYVLGFFVTLILGFSSWSVQYFQQSKQEVLVVYYANKKSLVGLIKGHDFYVSNSDSLSDKEQSQVLLPSQTGFGLLGEVRDLPINEIFQMQGVKVLVLTNKGLRPQHVDIMILKDMGLDWDIALIQLYQPKLIVLDSSFPRWKANKLQLQLENKLFLVHNVVRDGAYIFGR